MKGLCAAIAGVGARVSGYQNPLLGQALLWAATIRAAAVLLWGVSPRLRAGLRRLGGKRREEAEEARVRKLRRSHGIEEVIARYNESLMPGAGQVDALKGILWGANHLWKYASDSEKRHGHPLERARSSIFAMKETGAVDAERLEEDVLLIAEIGNLQGLFTSGWVKREAAAQAACEVACAAIDEVRAAWGQAQKLTKGDKEEWAATLSGPLCALDDALWELPDHVHRRWRNLFTAAWDVYRKGPPAPDQPTWAGPFGILARERVERCGPLPEGAD